MTNEQRKRKYTEEQEKLGRSRILLFVSPEDRAFLKALGKGNANDGIRDLIAMARSQVTTNDDVHRS